MPGLAVSMAPSGLSFADNIAYAKEAEELGYDSAWVPEVGGNDAFALGSAIGAATERMRIGTAVVPMNIRGPALLAMATSTMDAMAGDGRAICGIGVSTPQIVTDWNAAEYDKPLTRARETIEVLRQMFAGEKVVYDGKKVKVNGYRMMPGPRQPIPIYLGALNKKMLQLAGEKADGVIINMLGERHVPAVVAEVRKGAEKAGKNPDDVEIVMRVQCAVTDNPQQIRDAFAGAFGAYIVAPGYDTFFEWQGYGDVVEGVRAGRAAKDRAMSRAAVSDDILHDLVVAGSADEVRSRLKAFMNAGVTTPAIHIFWPDPNVAWNTMRSLAPRG
jgi:probable F420-dependent oxidoreductase